MTTTFGYARVSTNDQNLDLQIDALVNAGCDKKNIFKDKVSGTKAERPELNKCLEKLAKGDVLVVWRLDRLGRSMVHLVSLIDTLKEKGVGFKSICDGAIDTTIASGEAEHHLLELEEKWGKKYPAVLRSWNDNWENLSQYFKYPEALRRIIYTTNIVEGFHRQIRKYTKNKGAFTSENALLKLIYCACQKVLEKWSQPIHNWALIISQLQIYFDGRLNLGLR